MEVWKDIKGFEGLYQISNLGNVKSLGREKKIRSNGTQRLPEKILKFGACRGYHMINLYKGNKKINPSIHRLVAETFIPNPENKPTVNHINGIKTDNRVENLEWATYSENNKHAYQNGLKAPIDLKGEKSGSAKLTNANVSRIREMISEGVCQSEIARKFNVCRSNITWIKKGETWKAK